MGSERLPDATWTILERGIFIKRRAITIKIIIAIFAHLTADARRNRGPRDRAIGAVHLPEALSDGCEDTWKNSTIAVRSNRDRGAIEPRSWSIGCGINSTRASRDFREDLQ